MQNPNGNLMLYNSLLVYLLVAYFCLILNLFFLSIYRLLQVYFCLHGISLFFIPFLRYVFTGFIYSHWSLGSTRWKHTVSSGPLGKESRVKAFKSNGWSWELSQFESKIVGGILFYRQSLGVANSLCLLEVSFQDW